MNVKDEVRDKICLALDVDSLDLVKEIVEESYQYVGLYKVGKELFISEGASSIKIPQSFDRDVFLDLKLHDIPNTVQGASKAIVKHDVKMFTVHAMGGKEMIQAAVRGINEGSKQYENQKPKILGITVLTSHDANFLKEILIDKPLEYVLIEYAKLASKNGCDGIVCSSKDIRFISPHIDKKIIYVTPGVRLGEDKKSDQKRVSTPQDAISNGSSMIVVGRSIIDSENRKKVLKKIYEEVEKGLAYKK